jgi:hypothetical protein
MVSSSRRPESARSASAGATIAGRIDDSARDAVSELLELEGALGEVGGELWGGVDHARACAGPWGPVKSVNRTLVVRPQAGLSPT